MPTALGQRSGAVYGEKSPKTRLARIYCYGNTLYVVNLITWVSDVCVVHCIRRLFPMPLPPHSNLAEGCLFFFFQFTLLKTKIYICVAGKARQIMAYFY